MVCTTCNSEKVVFVIPNEKLRSKVKESCGENTHIVFITTPSQVPPTSSTFTLLTIRNVCLLFKCMRSRLSSKLCLITESVVWTEQLGALINASTGVVTTNTAALQLAIALKKPTYVISRTFCDASWCLESRRHLISM